MLLHAFLLFAEGEERGQGAFDNPIFLVMILMFGFFLLVILPNKRRAEKKRQEELANSLKKNAKVMTSSGIIGIVASVPDGDEITLKLEEGKVRILKSVIVKVFTSEDKDKAKEKESKAAAMENSTSVKVDKAK